MSARRRDVHVLDGHHALVWTGADVPWPWIVSADRDLDDLDCCCVRHAPHEQLPGETVPDSYRPDDFETS
jgi:hypothetical protein